MAFVSVLIGIGSRGLNKDLPDLLVGRSVFHVERKTINHKEGRKSIDT